MTDSSAIEVWRQRVRCHARDCEESAAGDEAQRLREAAALLKARPIWPDGCGDAVPDTAALEHFITARAFESAALALMGDDSAFMLSRSGEGRCLATLADHGIETTAEGASIALALLAAFARFLFAVSAANPRRADPAADPSECIH